MNGTVLRGGWVVCGALLAGGCGAIPDIIVDAAKSSAKEALQEAVESVIDDVIDDTFDELIDQTDFEFPSIDERENEDNGDALDGAVEEMDGNDQDTDRTGKMARIIVGATHPDPCFCGCPFRQSMKQWQFRRPNEL